MNILITDEIDSISSRYSYRSSKTSAQNDDNNSETIKEMGARVAAANTPIFMIDISSQGRAALQSLKLGQSSPAGQQERQAEAVESEDTQYLMQAKADDIADKDSYIDSSEDVQKSDMVSSDDTEEESSVQETVRTDGKDTDVTSASNRPMNLTMYSETELRQLLRENAITRSEMDAELRSRTGSRQPAAMQEAIAAYSYQMAFSDGVLAFAQ